MPDDCNEETIDRLHWQFTRAERKEIVKEALKEFLREQLDRGAATIGRWFVRVTLALIVAGTTYMILWTHGWSR